MKSIVGGFGYAISQRPHTEDNVPFIHSLKTYVPNMDLESDINSILKLHSTRRAKRIALYEYLRS